MTRESARFRRRSTHVPNLTEEFSTAKERRLNWFGTAVLVWCDKVCRTFVELNLGCPRLLVLQRVAQNAKSCSKVAEHNLFMPSQVPQEEDEEAVTKKAIKELEIFVLQIFYNFFLFISFFNYFTLSLFFYTFFNPRHLYPHPHPRPTPTTHHLYPRPTTHDI